MSQPEPLKQQLFKFAAHIRNPEKNPAPADIEDRRLGIYRELFFNNIKSFLDGTFPVLKSLYEEDSWEELARNFYALHRCQSPYFLEISQEFINYLQTEHVMRDIDPPYMFELAHYEWIELAVSVSDVEPDMSKIDSKASLLKGLPVLSPLAWLLTYTWPVHRISPDYRPDTPDEQVTCIIVYRDNNDDVQFTEINLITAKLLQQLEQATDQGTTTTAEEILQNIASEMGAEDSQPILTGGLEILQSLQKKGIILGVNKNLEKDYITE